MAQYVLDDQNNNFTMFLFEWLKIDNRSGAIVDSKIKLLNSLWNCASLGRRKCLDIREGDENILPQEVRWISNFTKTYVQDKNEIYLQSPHSVLISPNGWILTNQSKTDLKKIIR